MAAKPVLVTGSTGFLGSHIAQALCLAGPRSGVTIHVDYRSSERLQPLLAIAKRLGNLPLTPVFLDLTQHDSIETAIGSLRPGTIVHCAAYGVNYDEQDTARAIQINVAGTAALIEAAAKYGVTRFVNVGTSYEYGECDLAACPAPAPKPLNLYGSTKAAQTLIAMERARNRRLPATTVRPFSMFGPGEGMHKFVPQVALACLKGTPLDLTEGEQLRNYLYVKDVARAIVELSFSEQFPEGQILDLYSSTNLSIKAFGNLFAEAAGAAPGLLRWGARPYRGGEIMKNVGPQGCSPWIRETPIMQAAQDVIAWARQCEGTTNMQGKTSR